MNLAQETALNIPFMHVYPGASRVCLALRKSWVSSVLVFEKRGLEWLAVPFAASGLGQIFRSSSGKHSLLTVVRPWLLRGRRMSTEKKKKTCLSAKIGDKGSSEFCTGTCPLAFLWSFNLLWRASPFPQRSKRGLFGHLTVRKKCC